MKTIIEINSKIRENYKTVDAVDGIAKMYFNAHEKKNQLGIYAGNKIDPFLPDDNYDIQVAHIINGGRANNDSKFGEMTFTVEMIVISKFVKFYHILDLLNRMNIKAQEFDYNTQSVLKKIGAIEDYPELEAYSISYQFTARPGDFKNC